MRKFWILFLIASCGLVRADISKQQKRIQDLFIWKVSEELKLDAQTEAKFSKIVHQLGIEKHDAAEKMQDSIAKMRNANEREIQAHISEYETHLDQHMACQKKELDSLRKIFSPEQLARYLVVKQEILTNLKSRMASTKKP